MYAAPRTGRAGSPVGSLCGLWGRWARHRCSCFLCRGPKVTRLRHSTFRSRHRAWGTEIALVIQPDHQAQQSFIWMLEGPLWDAGLLPAWCEPGCCLEGPHQWAGWERTCPHGAFRAGEGDFSLHPGWEPGRAMPCVLSLAPPTEDTCLKVERNLGAPRERTFPGRAPCSQPGSDWGQMEPSIWPVPEAFMGP